MPAGRGLPRAAVSSRTISSYCGREKGEEGGGGVGKGDVRRGRVCKGLRQGGWGEGER